MNSGGGETGDTQGGCGPGGRLEWSSRTPGGACSLSPEEVRKGGGKVSTFRGDSLESLQSGIYHERFADETAHGVAREAKEGTLPTREFVDCGEGGGLAWLHIQPPEVNLREGQQRGRRKMGGGEMFNCSDLLENGLDVICLAHADSPGGDHHIAATHSLQHPRL
jgi:hypothetical protein